MDRKTLIFFSILVIVPILSLFYKLAVADLSLLPLPIEDTWNLQVLIYPKENVAYSEVSFPIPKNFQQAKVQKWNSQNQDLEFHLTKNKYGHLGSWEGEDWEVSNPIGYYAKIQISPYQHIDPEPDTSKKVAEKQIDYIALNGYLPRELEEAKKILQSIHPYDKDKLRAAKQIFYFVSEEVPTTQKEVKLVDTLLTRQGNSYSKSMLFSLLCRMREIPVRTVAGFDLQKVAEKSKDNKVKISYWNEISLNGKWYYVSTSKEIFAGRAENLIPLWKSVEQRRELGFESQTLRYTAYASRASVNRYNFKEYSEEVAGTHSFLKYYSLYTLPAPLQNLFRVVILIPIGALVLAFARNVIGVPTFGIFTPILLSMFFWETSLLFGMVFFTAMILLGFLERYALDRFYLLAVPRLSILLTITVLSLIVFSILNENLSLFSNLSVTLFPIVITTIFIERFSIMIIEEGVANTLVTLGGTFLIALITYTLFLFSSLQILFFTHPELLLIVIAIQLLLGQYKGYRLTELFRFQEIFRK
ncbi:7TM domain-containing protein [Leptospira idonii]|uniref:Transglutaminase n=1 Tax=Leptospira idonii TaxID=1193500 RepID=A0A4R9M008_9LEPT|nr:7TM domain-containing protein [Leptospira idonii]TGN18967.1 transglutaminase [Leptospira idonii]